MPVGMLVNKSQLLRKAKQAHQFCILVSWDLEVLVLGLRQTYCLNVSKFARVGRRTAKEADPDLLKFS